MKSLLLRSLVASIGKRKLSILIYHRVHKDRNPISPGRIDSEIFNWQMALVSKAFNVIPLIDAIKLLKGNRLPPGSLCITFDDGYADNATVALPILKQYGLTATFFVATGYLDGGLMWNDTVIETIRSLPNGPLDLSAIGLGKHTLESLGDRQRCTRSIINAIKYLPQKERQQKTSLLSVNAQGLLPEDLMMTSHQVKSLSDAGMEIGGHTVTHPILTTLEYKDAVREISEGKQQLEKITGKPVRLFAYPNGKPDQDYSSEHVNIVRELGYSGAVSTRGGVSNCKTDIYQLRRFTPWDPTPSRFMLRLLMNYQAS